MKNFFILTFLTITFNCFSQDTIIDEEVPDSIVLNKFGVNQKNFYYMYIGYGLVFGSTEGDGADIMMGYSSQFAIGLRYKMKISNFLSLGSEINYNSFAFRLKQDSTKILPNNEIHNKEKISFKNFGLALYSRFNFDTKRGNRMGIYLDLSIYGNWAFSTVIKAIDKFNVANSSGASKTKTIHSNLTFTEAFNYGPEIRFGIQQIMIYFRYRYSDLFKKDFIFPELPRFIAGVQVGFYK